jgi:hypothetical protein
MGKIKKRNLLHVQLMAQSKLQETLPVGIFGEQRAISNDDQKFPGSSNRDIHPATSVSNKEHFGGEMTPYRLLSKKTPLPLLKSSIRNRAVDLTHDIMTTRLSRPW